MITYLTDFYIYVYSLYYNKEEKEIPNPNLKAFIEDVKVIERKTTKYEDAFLKELKDKLEKPNFGLTKIQ